MCIETADYLIKAGKKVGIVKVATQFVAYILIPKGATIQAFFCHPVYGNASSNYSQDCCARPWKRPNVARGATLC